MKAFKLADYPKSHGFILGSFIVAVNDQVSGDSIVLFILSFGHGCWFMQSSCAYIHWMDANYSTEYAVVFPFIAARANYID